MKYIAIALSIVAAVFIFMNISKQSAIKSLKAESRFVKNKYVVCYLNSFYGPAGTSHEGERLVKLDAKMEETILSEILKMGWKYQREAGVTYLYFEESRIGFIDNNKNINWDNAQLGSLWGASTVSPDGKTEIFR